MRSGYTKTYLADNRIICYRFYDSIPETMEAWFEDARQVVIRYIRDDEPLRILLDYRDNQDTVLGNYGLQQTRELLGLRADIRGRICALFASRVLAEMGSIVFSGVPNNPYDVRFMADFELAIAWLLAAES